MRLLSRRNKQPLLVHVVEPRHVVPRLQRVRSAFLPEKPVPIRFPSLRWSHAWLLASRSSKSRPHLLQPCSALPLPPPGDPQSLRPSAPPLHPYCPRPSRRPLSSEARTSAVTKSAQWTAIDYGKPYDDDFEFRPNELTPRHFKCVGEEDCDGSY